MFKPNALPFDDLTPQGISNKSIPRKPDEFLEYLEYLATSPQLDHDAISDHIIQFLSFPKLKFEQKQAVFLALRDLNLTESFWAQMLTTIRTSLNPKDPLTESILISLCGAPPDLIKKEFNGFGFLSQYTKNENPSIRYAAFYALYNFRNFITINKDLVDSCLNQLKDKIPKLIFICLKFIQFFISIDFNDIEALMKPHHNELLTIARVHGHLMNIQHWAFIINQVRPSIQAVIEFLPHVSLSGAAFLLAALPSLHDFDEIVNIPVTSILPQIIDIITHPYSDGTRDQLFITALQILKKDQFNQNSTNQSKYFFSRLVDLMFLSNQSISLQVVSLFADTASSYQMLETVLSKADEASQRSNFFCDLAGIAAMLTQNDDKINIISELVKLLAVQNDSTRWELAASCIASYLWKQKQHVLSRLQNLFEVICGINNVSIRSLFFIFIAQFAPPFIRSHLIRKIKECLFPSRFNQQTTSTTFTLPESSAKSSIPLLMQLGLVRSLATIGEPEELQDIKDQLENPLYKMVYEQAVQQKEITAQNKNHRHSSLSGQLESEEAPPISAFFCCDVVDIGMLSAALEFPSSLPRSDFLGVERPFIEISPVYHAMTIEIASTMIPKYRSLCVDLRISSKGIVPAIDVFLDVPISLTPPQVPVWSVKDINEGSKVTHRFSFTVNRMENPFALIRVCQQDTIVLTIKVCLPLIDLFEKVHPDEWLTRCIWQKLMFEKKDVDLPDSTWVSPQGCISVKNKVARASQAEYLDLLYSAIDTCSVVD